MQDFRGLLVWRRAHRLAVTTYRETHRFPRRDAAVASQLRRAALSIPANIAEGCGRRTRRDLVRFLQIAVASASEVEYHLLFARDVGALPDPLYRSLDDELRHVRRMLVGLIERVRSREAASSGGTDD